MSINNADLSVLLKRPLNGLEIQVLNPNAKVLTYTQLYDYDNVDELFSGNCNQIILLYLLINERAGHWTTIFKNQDGYNFFDPYGVPPDYELQLLNKQKRMRFNEECDYVVWLFRDDKIIFNNIQYQQRGTATCGCFVSHRLNYSHLDDNQYLSIFLSIPDKTPDEVVATYCYTKLMPLL